MSSLIRYEVSLNQELSMYLVDLLITPQAENVEVYLAKWIPGSYMIRDFSRHLFAVTSLDCEIVQIAPNRFRLANLTPNKSIKITYKVYANSTGIRTCTIGVNRAYFNPSSICLTVAGSENNPHQLKIINYPSDWQIFAALESKDNEYIASSYDKLIDSPFELGWFVSYRFDACNIPHQVIISANYPLPSFDTKRLLDDLTLICEYQIKMFGGAPFNNYTFILNLDENIYTGLEHLSSTLIAAPYYSLPRIANKNNHKDYVKLLGLISHEYFHAWNVKSIKPQSFLQYDVENHPQTELLWWFEGITSYFDDWVLYQVGLITLDEYMQLMTDNFNNVLKYDGVNWQSLYQSSIDAWVKYYQQDAYSRNIIASYYVKGALLGFMLDIQLRAHNTSLSRLMKDLYSFVATGGIIPNDAQGFSQLIEKLSNNLISSEYLLTKINAFKLNFIDEDKLCNIGLELVTMPTNDISKSVTYNTTFTLAKDGLYLGADLTKLERGFRVNNIDVRGVFALSGIANNDIIIAINQISVSNIELELNLYSRTEELILTVIRLNNLLNIKLNLDSQQLIDLYNLKLIDSSLLNNFLQVSE